MGKDKLVRREGRPSKLSKELVTALETIADKEEQFVLFTDEELVEELNSRLPNDKSISYSTFRNYAKDRLRYDNGKDDIYLSQFLTLLKSIRRKQKQWLTKNMLESGAGNWQKFGWIGERKFNDLNLTHKVDHTTGGESFNKVVIDDSYMKEIDAADAEIIDED